MVTVLIVDDDVGYVNALTEGLTALGHNVTSASSMPEALALLDNMTVDIAVLDMIMEGGGAISLVHELRGRGYEFPIIVATGRPQIADSPVFRQGLRGADAKIEKTATLAEIDKLVRSLLKG